MGSNVIQPYDTVMEGWDTSLRSTEKYVDELIAEMKTWDWGPEKEHQVEHQEVLDELHEIFVAKNSDYGNSATHTFNAYGVLAYLVRMEDKMARLRSLVSKADDARRVRSESVEDTLMDLANYCVMAVMDLRKQEESQ